MALVHSYFPILYFLPWTKLYSLIDSIFISRSHCQTLLEYRAFPLLDLLCARNIGRDCSCQLIPLSLLKAAALK